MILKPPHGEVLSRLFARCIELGMAPGRNREIVSWGKYATPADFEQIFTEDMSGLYLLSFLLTGDRDQAEACFVGGIGESVKTNRVFKEWARSWARRTIVRRAIRLIEPRQHPEAEVRKPFIQTLDDLPPVLRAEVAAILQLAPLERFVFVMSALERYSDHECSLLLGCTRRDVTEARARGLQQLARLMNPQRDQTVVGLKQFSHENARLVMEMTIARYFGTQSSNASISR